MSYHWWILKIDIFGLFAFVIGFEKLMESEYGMRERLPENLEELSICNLRKLVFLPKEIVLKLCNLGNTTRTGLDYNDCVGISNSNIVKEVGLYGIGKLHLLGKKEEISFEELELLHDTGVGRLIGIPELRKLCKSGVILDIDARDLQDLGYVMLQTDLTVEEIKKICYTGVLKRFSIKGVVLLSEKGHVKSLSTENLTKFCRITGTGIRGRNIKKILNNQEIISCLDEHDLRRLFRNTPLLDQLTGKELLEHCTGPGWQLEKQLLFEVAMAHLERQLENEAALENL